MSVVAYGGLRGLDSALGRVVGVAVVRFDGQDTHDDWPRVLARDPCAYCDRPSRVVDHIVPRVRHGGNRPENLTGACAACNASKRSRSLLSFLGYRCSGVPERLEALQIERALWAGVGI